MEKIISLPLLDESTDNLEAKKLLTSTKAKMGFIPNIFAMMANSPGLLETYFLGDAKFREISSLTAVEQEIARRQHAVRTYWYFESAYEDVSGILIEVKDFGAFVLDNADDYPDYIIPLAKAVAANEVERGIAICAAEWGQRLPQIKLLG
jgi:hypothetical protein